MKNSVSTNEQAFCDDGKMQIYTTMAKSIHSLVIDIEIMDASWKDVIIRKKSQGSSKEKRISHLNKIFGPMLS